MAEGARERGDRQRLHGRIVSDTTTLVTASGAGPQAGAGAPRRRHAEQPGATRRGTATSSSAATPSSCWRSGSSRRSTPSTSSFTKNGAVRRDRQLRQGLQRLPVPARRRPRRALRPLLADQPPRACHGPRPRRARGARALAEQRLALPLLHPRRHRRCLERAALAVRPRPDRQPRLGPPARDGLREARQRRRRREPPGRLHGHRLLGRRRRLDRDHVRRAEQRPRRGHGGGAHRRCRRREDRVVHPAADAHQVDQLHGDHVAGGGHCSSSSSRRCSRRPPRTSCPRTTR